MRTDQIIFPREQTRVPRSGNPIPVQQRPKRWSFRPQPPFFGFSTGEKDYEWGSPSYSVLGWQKPLERRPRHLSRIVVRNRLRSTDEPAAIPTADCMVHCGYEPTARNDAMQPENPARSIGSGPVSKLGLTSKAYEFNLPAFSWGW